jgi:uncharacterized protein YecT (DUF1311 family)
MKKIILIISAMTLLFSQFTFADEDTIVIKEYERLIIATKVLVESDIELNKTYDTLKNLLKTDQKKKLTTAQRTWVQYRNSACDFTTAKNPRYLDMDCSLEVNKRRIEFLNNALRECKVDHCPTTFADNYKDQSLDKNHSTAFLVINPDGSSDICKYPGESYDKVFCISKHAVNLENEIDNQYSAILNLLNAQQKTKFIVAQNQWKAYLASLVATDNVLAIDDNFKLEELHLQFLTDRLRECKIKDCNNTLLAETDIDSIYKKAWKTRD